MSLKLVQISAQALVSQKYKYNSQRFKLITLV
jgi:hypothetical protein